MLIQYVERNGNFRKQATYYISESALIQMSHTFAFREILRQPELIESRLLQICCAVY